MKYDIGDVGKNTDLRGWFSGYVLDRLHGIGMYKNVKVILTQDQITSDILRLANARGIEIVVDEFFEAMEKIKNEKRMDKGRLPNYKFEFPKGIHYSKLPDSVFFNDKKKATTLMFDKKATVVKTSADDEYSRRVGFLEAYFQATCGLSKNKALKYLKNIVEDKEK